MGKPLQIIKTGTDNDNTFEMNEENIKFILDQIPPDMKVAVVSVVGAFRTGKSFLLTFFLRYLRHGNPEDISEEWMKSDGSTISEGNMNEVKSNSEEEKANHETGGFAWRGGQDRQTTGMWMWSEPFIRKVEHYPDPIAILLLDTQGMFDNETTMTLTAQIFGLSTLISSFQIYNVDKRIQEDNLQHLALFSEYGRMAIGEQTPGETLVEEQKTSADTESLPPPLTRVPSLKREASRKVTKPFQRLEFLVRDWQNFSHDWDDCQTLDDQNEMFEKLHSEMNTYLVDVIKPRGADDLKSTREQIAKCFEKVGCFLLPHPGFSVTKKNYDGSIDKIEGPFRGLLNRYVRLIFDKTIQPKLMNGNALTSQELFTFIQVYVALFQDAEKSFPKAMTMLEATADANNRNAYDRAFNHYTTAMNKYAGVDAPFLKESTLNQCHNKAMLDSLKEFDAIANMGDDSSIEKKRSELIENIEKERVRYFDANSNRNPFKNSEYYVLPVLVMISAWVLSTVIDLLCSTDACEKAEDGFKNIYLFVLFIMIFMGWKHFSGSFNYLKDILPILLQGKLKLN